MSWHERYTEQAKAWRELAQREASQGRESEAELANKCAHTYERLAQESAVIDIPAQVDILPS